MAREIREGINNYTCTLEKKVQKIAFEEINEDAEQRDIYVEKLKCWMQNQNFVVGESCYDNLMLLKILRHSKFDYERSRRKIHAYYTSRSSIPQWYLDRDPGHPEILPLLKLGLFIPMKYDQNDRRIIIVRLGYFDPARHNYDHVMKLATIVADFLLTDEQTQVMGINLVADFSKFGFSHACVYSPACLRKIALMLQDCLPLRIKGFHCWKTPFVFNAVHQLASVFLSEKLAKRFQIHGKNTESLHSMVHSDYLPEEFGGTAGPLQKFIDLAENEILQFHARLSFDDDYQLNENWKKGASEDLQ